MNINLVYSGGLQNTSQKNSLGGFPSPVAITENKNNLFDDITSQETTRGFQDFKCIYVFNDDTKVSYTTTIYIEYLSDIGATIELGLLQQNAIQNLNFPQTVTGGTFNINIQGQETPSISWNGDPNVLGASIETAIKTITDCSVEVVTPGQTNYNITFSGVMKNKFIADMLITNNLLPSGVTPGVSSVQSGSPINTVAPETLNTVLPFGINFIEVLSPGIVIGTLNSAEGFPLWVKRTLPAGFEAVEGDGYNLHIKVTSV